MRLIIRRSEWRRAAPGCRFGPLVPAAIAHLRVGLSSYDAERTKDSASVSGHSRLLLCSLYCDLLVPRFGVSGQACHADESSGCVRCRSHWWPAHSFVLGDFMAFASPACGYRFGRLSALDSLDLFTESLSMTRSWPKNTRQPMPGARLSYIPAPLARRGCAGRSH